MSSIIYAGVGGTGPYDDGDYLGENGVDTYVVKLSVEWPYGAGKLYYRGPSGEGLGTNTVIVGKVVRDVLDLKAKTKDYAGLVLCGHSRGAAAMIVAARRLMMMGESVDVLVLLDPVNMTPWPESHAIPSNVKNVIKPLRNPLGYSRPFWGNCGLVWNPLTTTVEKEHFMGTHAAMGGQTWAAENLVDGYIKESYEPMRTSLTLGNDIDARANVWNFVQTRLAPLCEAMIKAHGASAAGNGKPVGGGTGGGTGGGGGGNPGGGNTGGGKMHTVVSGESLSLIAGKYWGDVLLWPILYDANRGVVGPDPNKIEVGMKLTVPSISGYSKQQLEEVRARGRNWR